MWEARVLERPEDIERRFRDCGAVSKKRPAWNNANL
jgi:hypothetical protein